MTIHFDLKEVDDLIKKLDKLEDKLRRSVERKALKKGMERLQGVAQSLAPIGPPKGELKARIKDSFEITTRTKKGNVTVRCKNRAPHAHLQEFGWFLTKGPAGGKQTVIGPVGQPYERGPKPFMRPAVDQTGPAIRQDVITATIEALAELETK